MISTNNDLHKINIVFGILLYNFTKNDVINYHNELVHQLIYELEYNNMEIKADD